MKHIKLSLALLLSITMVACSESKKEGDIESSETVEQVKDVEPGSIDPMKDYPKGETSANVGDVVLVPPLHVLRQESNNGVEMTPTFYYANFILFEKGSKFSIVDFDGEKETVPNYLIIPVHQNQKTENGDIVYTIGKMLRYEVVNSDNQEDIVVRSLYSAQEENCVSGTYNVLSSLWGVGSTVAVKGGANYFPVRILNTCDDKVLTQTSGGVLHMYSKSECQPVPAHLEVNVGDAIQAPKVGRYINTVVVEVDSINRVWVEDDFGGEPFSAYQGEIAKDLQINN